MLRCNSTLPSGFGRGRRAYTKNARTSLTPTRDVTTCQHVVTSLVGVRPRCGCQATLWVSGHVVGVRPRCGCQATLWMSGHVMDVRPRCGCHRPSTGTSGTTPKTVPGNPGYALSRSGRDLRGDKPPFRQGRRALAALGRRRSPD
jgi:hypothetical protein